MIRNTEAWLAQLSDPAGTNARWQAKPFDASGDAAAIGLLDEAARHNVHLVAGRNLLGVLKDNPGSFYNGDPALVIQRAAALQTAIRDRRLQEIAHNTVLAGTAREILHAAAGMPVALVKGLDFAEAVYHGVHNRKFSDVDLLVAPSAQQDIANVLSGLGFAEVIAKGKKIEQTERQWTRQAPHAGLTLVEVHTDMVHAPELRARMSLTHALYAGRPNGGVTGAARLVLAALHGATSHLFARLQYVVDGMMVARAGVDAKELKERAKRSGALLPVSTMLRLAVEIYGCQASGALLGQMEPVRFAAVERRLISPAMVISAKSQTRWQSLPQRFLYRRMMQAGI